MTDQKVSALADGTTPQNTDEFLIARAGGNNFLTWSEMASAIQALNVASATKLQTARNIDGQAFDGTAAVTVIAPGTHAATSKATPVDADELPLVDSAASNVLKKLTWANLKATLKTYFDTLYAPALSTSVLASDAATQNNNTLANTGLSFAMSSSATETWLVECILLISAANSTMDVKIAWSVPSGATYVQGADTLATAAAGWGGVATASSPVVLNTASLALGSAASASVIGVKLTAIISGGGSSGTVNLQAAQNTTDAGNFIVKKNSYLRATKIIA